jgi:hypothetical protein
VQKGNFENKTIQICWERSREKCLNVPMKQTVSCQIREKVETAVPMSRYLNDFCCLKGQGCYNRNAETRKHYILLENFVSNIVVKQRKKRLRISYQGEHLRMLLFRNFNTFTRVPYLMSYWETLESI